MHPDFSRSLHILLSWSLEQTGLASSTWRLFYWHILIVLHINTNYHKNIFLLVFYPSPLLPTSLQWPLTPLPQVAVVKSFECKNIFPVYLKWAWINRSIKTSLPKFLDISTYSHFRELTFPQVLLAQKECLEAPHLFYPCIWGYFWEENN